MIDTLKIMLSDSLISSKNKLSIIPSQYEAQTGLIINESIIFVDSQKTKYFGLKAIYNDDKIQVTIINKYALMQDKSNKDIFNEEYHEGNTKIFCQLSLPKFFNNNNFKATNLYELEKHLKKIEVYLKTIGIYTNILQAKLSRLDTFLNIKTKYVFKSYSDIFSGLNLSRYKSFEYAGTTFLFKNTQTQICIYDKIKELENQNIDFKINGNYIRFENRLLKKKKILDSIGTFELNQLSEHLKYLKENYKQTIESKIFLSDKQKHLTGEILDQEVLNKYLLELKQTKGRNYFDLFLKELGSLYIKEFNKENMLRDVINNLGLNKKTIYRYQKKINDINFSNILEISHNKIKNKDLYHELYDNFYKELDKIDYE